MHTTEFHFPEAQKLLILLWSPVIHFQVSGKQGFRLWDIGNSFWNVGNYRFCSESTNDIYGIEVWEIKVCSSLDKFWWALDQDIISFHAFAVILASSPKGLTLGPHRYKSGQDAVLIFCGGSYFFTVARTVSCDKDAPLSTMLYHMIRQAASLYAISKSSPSWGRIVGLELEAHIPFLP